MAEHSPEPWRAGTNYCVVSDQKGPGVDGADEVEYYGGFLICESVAPENARRIVACVNACEGIPTGALSFSRYAHPAVAIVHLQSENITLTEQRDELLAALKLAKAAAGSPEDVYYIASDAIAKVEAPVSATSSR